MMLNKVVRSASSRNQQRKLVGERDKGVADRVSQLPDDVLISILSCLTMKEAARTSILSRRWQKLWLLIPVLNFNAQEILDDFCLRHKYTFEPRGLESERKRYSSWVNQVLKSYECPTVDAFRIRFDLNSSYSDVVDIWLDFAVKRKVKRLELNLSTYLCHQHINTCSPGKLQPQSGNLGFPTFEFLTTLELNDVNVTGDILEYFISTCTFLESLHVEGSKSLVSLKVDGWSLPLKYLCIYFCYSLEYIEISATNLKSFKYHGPKIVMHLKSVPALTELMIGGKHTEELINSFYELSRYEQLKTLCLSMDGYFIEQPFVLTPVTHLKYLDIRIYTDFGRRVQLLSKLIEASPLLERFTFRLSATYHSRKRGLEKPMKCIHNHLKVVEFIGFIGVDIDVELAMYLIENAVVLKKLVIDTRCPKGFGFTCELQETRGARVKRERARQLESKLNPGTEFVFIQGFMTL